MFVSLLSLSSLSLQNNPSKKGQSASDCAVFGEGSRYKVGAVHTRFGISWFVWDAEEVDSVSGSLLVIRQECTLYDAINGLTLPHEAI